MREARMIGKHKQLKPGKGGCRRNYSAESSDKGGNLQKNVQINRVW